MRFAQAWPLRKDDTRRFFRHKRMRCSSKRGLCSLLGFYIGSGACLDRRLPVALRCASQWPPTRRTRGRSGELGTRRRRRRCSIHLPRLRQARKKQENPTAGRLLQAVAWTTTDGSGTRPEERIATGIFGTSHGDALDGQSMGTGAGDGGLATTRPRTTTVTGRTCVLAGSKSDPDYGARPGLHGRMEPDKEVSADLERRPLKNDARRLHALR